MNSFYDFPLWTNQQLCIATSGEYKGNKPIEASGVSIDTRSLKEGDVFIALTGEKADGHSYLQTAWEKGAAIAVVSEKGLENHPCPKDLPIIIVKNTYDALWAMARFARFRFTGKVVAVTGSVGKTGFKEFLHFTAGKQGRIYANEGNLNNLYGVPLSLARLGTWMQWAVFELGMSAMGEIRQLTMLVRPDIAVITRIADAHSAFFQDEESIATAKAEILEGLEPHGTIIVYRDMPSAGKIVDKAKHLGVNAVITYGMSQGSDCHLRSYVANADEGTMQVETIFLGRLMNYNLSVLSPYLALTSLAVLATCQVLGLTISRCLDSINQWQVPKGRGNRVLLILPGNKSVLMLNDSYNASPAAMMDAIEWLGKITPKEGGRRIAILGDMLELKNPQQQHQDLASLLIKANVAQVHITGELMQHLWANLPQQMQGMHANPKDIAEKLPEQLHNHDIILIKGSKGSHVFEVASLLENRYASVAMLA